MDNRPIYIKMADCEEIQELRKEGISDNVIRTCSHQKCLKHRGLSEPETFIAMLRPDYVFHNGDIWLPRQDDLQKMCGEMSAYLLYRFWDFLTEGKGEYPLNAYAGALFGSMEQLWLGFVMKTLHSKIWSNEAWISE